MNLLVLVFLAASFLVPQSAADSAPSIVVTSGKYGPYYHLRMDLRAADVIFAESDRRVRDGGQFDLRLRASRFPVRAPACRGPVILRMPWTATSQSGAAAKIRVKADLLRRIRALESDGDASVPVVIELNPYVRVAGRSPLRLELTGCNVFFRHAAGGYVDQLPVSGRRP